MGCGGGGGRASSWVAQLQISACPLITANIRLATCGESATVSLWFQVSDYKGIFECSCSYSSNDMLGHLVPY